MQGKKTYYDNEHGEDPGDTVERVEKGTFDAGKLVEGKCKTYSGGGISGVPRHRECVSTGTFKHGVLHGEGRFVHYNSDGTKWRTKAGTFDGGRLVKGTCKTYWSRGVFDTMEGTFEDGRLVRGTKTKHRGGEQTVETRTTA